MNTMQAPHPAQPPPLLALVEPVRPPSAYLLFTTAEGSTRTVGVVGRDKSRLLGVQWREMDDATREPYMAEGRRLMAAYKISMAEFVANGGIRTPRKMHSRDADESMYAVYPRAEHSGTGAFTAPLPRAASRLSKNTIFQTIGYPTFHAAQCEALAHMDPGAVWRDTNTIK